MMSKNNNNIDMKKKKKKNAVEAASTPTTTNLIIPWSKKHKSVTKATEGGLTYNLSNSFAEPFTCQQLIDWTLERGDDASKELVNEYYTHDLHYTPNGGSMDLRRAISELYGDNITPHNIVVFPGAQVALQTASKAVLSLNVIDDETETATSTTTSTHAITFTPGYQSVQQGPILAGFDDVTTITLKAKNQWQIDLKEVEAAIRPNTTKYIVLNEPYNPAGTLMSAETQTALVQLANQYGIYILCDEVYRFLEHDPQLRLPAMADCCYDNNKGLLSAVTLSKSWGGCGIAIGWIACGDVEVIEKLHDVQYFNTACPSRASELQAIMVLRASDTILTRNMKIIRHNKQLLVQFMNDYNDLFAWVPPTAGAIAAIRFLGPLTSNELGEALAKEGISIKPAYCFTDSVHITKENDYFRVGFGESIMPTALEALRQFVERHKDEWRKVI